MKVKAYTIRKILDRISEKTGFTQDFTGFKEMTDEIGLKNPDYLYKKMHSPIQNTRDKDEIGLGRLQLNIISEYLGFNSFYELEGNINTKINPQLSGVIGSYYCYVRSNLEKQGVVFRSPVRIFEKGRAIHFELKGPSNTFKGEISLRSGCLFVLMTSKEGKAFHHVYKIGNRPDPRVLQGTFSGVSTAFDPIGGRTVLIRQQENFSDLSNRRSDISVLKKSNQLEERLLASYFREYTNNNVGPNKSTGFNLDDLR
jgi:hypothetical protein